MKKRIVPLTLTLLLIASCTLAVVQTDRLRQARHTLEELQCEAISRSAVEMQALTLALEKLLISGQAAQQAELLYAVAQSAGEVQQALAALPPDALQTGGALALIGRLQADAAALLPQVTQGALSPTVRRQFSEDLTACSRLSSQLALAGDLPSYVLSGTPADNLSPLAEARPPAPPRGLPEDEVSREEARAIARSFVGADLVSSAEDAPDASGVLPAYGVTVHTPDVQLNLEITRQGGKVLWMMPETAAFTELRSPEECVGAALDFLSGRGFADSEAVYAQVYDGLCVISAVPTQDGVLLYPDMLTVQVRMDTLQTVGLEARSYWTNHVPRRLDEPALSAQDAVARLSDEVVCTGTRLCLIPARGSEALCWQCETTWNGDTYYIYIDAQSGEERAIRKLIPLENGMTAA